MKRFRIEIERIWVETLVLDVDAENLGAAEEVRDRLNAEFNSNPDESLGVGVAVDGDAIYFQALAKPREIK